MRAPSIAEIAARDEAAGGYYFSRDTLRFFHQRRADFSRTALADGRVYLAAAMRDRDGRRTGTSRAVWSPTTGRVTPAHGRTFEEIETESKQRAAAPQEPQP